MNGLSDKTIVYLANEEFPIPPVRGGAVETWVFEIANRIRIGRRIVCSSFDEKLKSFLPRPHFDMHFFRPGILARLMLCSWKLPFKNPNSSLFFLPFSTWASRIARQNGADIIHLHTRLQFLSVLRRLNPRAKIIFHAHNVSAVESGKGLWPERKFQDADLVVACSEFLKEEILARYPGLQPKMRVFYNGVDLERFAPDEEARRVIRRKLGVENDEALLFYSGRLVEYKGVHLLVEAFSKMAGKYERVKLVLAGGLTYSNNAETPYSKSLRKTASHLGDRVKFLGYVDHAQMPAYFNAADIVVVPSVWEEPFGVVTIEGMASGKCVVAFSRGGIKEIIHSGLDGWLIKDITSDELCAVLEKLVSDKSLREQLGVAARTTAERRFGWDRIVSSVEGEYEKLLDKRGTDAESQRGYSRA